MSAHRFTAISTGLSMALLGALTSALAASAPPETSTCLACHGANGEGMAAAGYPRLAGLSSLYLTEQLNAYIDGRRVNAIMSGIANPLSAQQIQSIADYFSALPASSAPSPSALDAAQSSLGRQLAERGDWDNGIPACFNCHASGGIGVQPAFPPIAGQPAAYIEAQIKAWKTGTRQGSPQNLANALMYSVAMRMDETQTKAVAAWLAAQPLPAPDTRPAHTKP